jgi:hypothetical protein
MTSFRSQSKDTNKKKQEYQAAVEGEQLDIKPRPKPKKGLNVFMWIPSISEKNGDPYRHLSVHYNPFHLCSNGQPVEDPETLQTTIPKDRSRRGHACVRCRQAWEAWENEGFKGVHHTEVPADRKPRRDQIKSNVSSQQMLIQVVNVTPFFKTKIVSRKERATPDMKMIRSHFDDFMLVLDGKEPENELPEDIMECAKAGVYTLVISNGQGKGNGFKLVDKLAARCDEVKDPLLDPSSNLLEIHLAPSGKELPSGGQVYDWTVYMTEPSISKEGWQITDEMMDVLAQHAVDIHNLPVEDDTLASKARALQHLSEEEMLEFLADNNWSLGEALPEEEEAAPAKESKLGLQEEEEMPSRPKSSAGLLSKLRDKAVANLADDDIPF